MKRIICYALPISLLIGVLFLACEGPAGPKGDTGSQGPVGPSGEGGSVMLAGAGEPASTLGSSGDFYIDLSSGNLYGPKTESGWGAPLSLTGPPGQDGQDGEDGNDGNDGQDGQDGADGSQIYAGDGPPSNAIGEPGDYYLDTENYHMYGPKTGSGWGSFLNLQGPPGTANVRYSPWISIEWNALDHPSWKRMQMNETFITDEFLDTGMAMLYIRNGSGHIYALPFVDSIYSYRYWLNSEMLIFDARSTDGSDVDIIWIIEIRYILIPGGMPLKAPDGFWGDYDAVKRYLGIPD